MGENIKQVLGTGLNVFAWAFLVFGGVFVAYGIYGRIVVRVARYGFGVFDILIPLFAIAVVLGGFFGIRFLSRRLNTPK